MNILRYADKTVLNAGNEEDLQRPLEIVEAKKNRKLGLELKSKKRGIMVVREKNQWLSVGKNECP